MKRQTKLFFATMALALGLSTPALAANVTVALPQFPVTLNGTVIDNSYRQYPLLVYKDITYFPMTYYDCRFLGVETEWTRQNGLKIVKSDLSGAYHQQNAKGKNSRSATARITTGKITVNGKTIDNSKEKYPLFSYRDVTYFPLTWRFAVNEFGWDYHFNGAKGLTIDATNQKTASTTLNQAQTTNGAPFAFALDQKNLYYEGVGGVIYKRPLNRFQDDAQQKQVMKIQGYYDENAYSQCRMEERNGQVYLHYWVGGAIMGGEFTYRLRDTTFEWVADRENYYDFGSFQIIADASSGWSDPKKLTYQDANGRREIGEAQYYYRAGGNRTGYNGNNTSLGKPCVDYWNNQLYTVAWKNDGKDNNHLCSVDLKTGKTTVLSQHPTDAFQLSQGIAYYLSEEQQNGVKRNCLYAIDLMSGTERYVGIVGKSDTTYEAIYAAASNGVYFRDASSSSLLFYNSKTGKREILNNGFRVNWLAHQNGYVVACFEEHPKNNCRFAVYKPSGSGAKLVFNSADCSDAAAINQNSVLVYRLVGTKQLVMVQL